MKPANWRLASVISERSAEIPGFTFSKAKKHLNFDPHLLADTTVTNSNLDNKGRCQLGACFAVLFRH